MFGSNIKIYKGNIVFTKTKDEFTIIENGYIIVEGGKVLKTAKELPDEYKHVPIKDYGYRFIFPGFCDLHIHAPQHRNRGLCLDLPLIDWLFQCTLPEEGKFKNLDYAVSIYKDVINQLWDVGTTRSLIYNTVYKESTELLMEMVHDSGLGAYIGKVNMDLGAPSYIIENTEQSLIETEEIIRNTKNKYPLVKPIITPRFVPSCTPQLMAGLGLLAQKYDVPVMSHLSEELEELKIVKSMYPSFPTYGSIYNYFGLFGQKPTVMAHCVFSDENEQSLIKHNGVMVAHCPTSNCSLGSGMTPARQFLNKGIKMGLGSDIAGGGLLNMLTVIAHAIEVSKMIWIYSSKTLPPLTLPEAFYLATKGGGSFFGKVGSFEEGYEFDAIVIDDINLNDHDYTINERIQRIVYLGENRNITDKYVSGRYLNKPELELYSH